MITFLSLPYEIRKQIYDLSLLTPDIIYPYEEPFDRNHESPWETDDEEPFERDYEEPFDKNYGEPFERDHEEAYERDYEEPFERKYDPLNDLELPRRASPADLAVGLLGTNHFIGYETRPIFYGGNTWHLSINGTESNGRLSTSVFQKYARQFRKIHVSFDVRDLSQEAILERADLWDKYFGGEDIGAGDPQNVQTMHELLWRDPASLWQWKMIHIQNMTLDELTIDLKHAYCPSACCKYHGFGAEYELESEKENEPAEPTPFAWLGVLMCMDNIPANLKSIKIMINKFNPKAKEVLLAHDSGLACSMCKNNDSELDVKYWDFLDLARLYIARAKNWKDFIRG